MDKLIENLLNEQAFLLKSLQNVNDELLRLHSSKSIRFEGASYKEDFPLSGKVSEKVMWLFNNVFNEGKRFTQIQETFNKYNGSERNLEGVIRGLKSKGKLIIVKHNKSNKLSFWGLPKWVNDDGFKNEHIPKDILSLSIETIEVIK